MGQTGGLGRDLATRWGFFKERKKKKKIRFVWVDVTLPCVRHVAGACRCAFLFPPLHLFFQIRHADIRIRALAGRRNLSKRSSNQRPLSPKPDMGGPLSKNLQRHFRGKPGLDHASTKLTEFLTIEANRKRGIRCNDGAREDWMTRKFCSKQLYCARRLSIN